MAFIISGLIVVVGITFVLLKPKQKISEEAKVYINKLYSFSGELTPKEKQNYYDNAFELEKLLVQEGNLPEKEMERIKEHTRALIINNPDLILSAQEYDQRYGHILGHTHGHPHGEDLQQEKQIALEQVNAAISDLEASEIPEEAKEGLRSILNLRRESLMIKQSKIDEATRIYIEFLKNDPGVVGVMEDPITGEYIPTYLNMLKVYRRRTHNVDGTVDDVVTGITQSSSTPENQQALQAYETALNMTPPGETPPSPPDIEGLRFSVEYEDVYLNSEEVTTDKADHPMDQTVTSNTSDEETIKVEQPDEHPKVEEDWQDITDDVILLQDLLKDIDDPQTQREITIFLEEALGVPFDKFLQMSDAEIEDEFRKMFAPTDAEIEAKFKDMLIHNHAPVSDFTMFENNLRKNFTQMRTQRAIATINQLGPKKGLERLKEVDPEIAKQLEVYIQNQDRENQK
ncbi:hypothetical protein C6497_03880 [Candidatus Poribacteria bacterium]|nr:MAG: hypothetical protein C6497_03880 [Candidatus Poribacteria bacterium]